MKFVNPKNDIAFRKIFGNENKKEILISFLNAALDLKNEKEIKEIEILNSYQAPKIESLKYTLLDIRAKDKRNVSFIVEMQIENVAGYKKRFLYYTSKAYTSQIERGEDYPKLNQVIFIGILDFIAFEGTDYITRHLILNNKTYKQEIVDFEFNFIELPKFTKKEHEVKTVIDKWIFFIKNAADLDIMPANADFHEIQEAYEEASKFKWTKEELEVYDYWSIRTQDERGAIELAHQKGIEKGREEDVKRMHKKGLEIEQIAELLEISIDKVEKIVAVEQ